MNVVIEVHEWSTLNNQVCYYTVQDSISNYTQQLFEEGYTIRIEALSGWVLYGKETQRVLLSELTL